MKYTLDLGKIQQSLRELATGLIVLGTLGIMFDYTGAGAAGIGCGVVLMAAGLLERAD